MAGTDAGPVVCVDIQTNRNWNFLPGCSGYRVSRFQETLQGGWIVCGPKGDQEAGSDHILAAKFSPSGEYYATCDDNKNLTLWKTTGEAWTQLSVRSLVRRCTSLCFSRSHDYLVVGDKSGDVYSFSVSNPEEPGVSKLGHVSMLLDVCLCGRDEEYVATADRDEKVRVSCFPNCYNIQSFCLGHKEFVSRLLYLHEADILISGAGDGTVRLWDYSVGKELHSEACHLALNPQGQTEGQEEGQGQSTKDTENADVTRLSFYPKNKILAVSFDRNKSILLYKLIKEGEKCSLSLHQKIDLEAEVWDLTFDSQGDIWLLQRKEGGAIVFREEKDGSGNFVQISESGEAAVQTTLTAMNGDWETLKESLTTPSSFANFQKSKMDSQHFYFEKKQQRLTEATKRGKDTTVETSSDQDQNQSPEEKKAKIDSDN